MEPPSLLEAINRQTPKVKAGKKKKTNTSKDNTSDKKPTTPLLQTHAPPSTQNHTGTWSYTGGLGVEAHTQPALRSTSAKLEMEYDKSLLVLNKNYETSNDNSDCDNDYLSFQANVDAALSLRKLICLAVEASADPTAKAPIDDTFADSFGYTFKSFTDMKRTMARALYSQKHSDLTLGSLVGQIEVKCLEQGRLLRRVREEYAAIFQSTSKLHSDSIWQLETSAQTISNLRSSVYELEDKKVAFEAAKTSETMDAKREASRLVEEANQNTVEVSEEYERKIATMNKSLFTLQKIVKAMSDDTGLVRGGDMSAQLLKFRKEWEEQREELKALQPLKGENKTLTVKLMLRENMLKSIKSENKQLQKELDRKDKLLAMFINQRKGEVTDEEYKLLKSKEERAEVANSDNEEEEEVEEEAVERPPTCQLCILCSKRLDDAINLKDKLINGPPKLPAEAFRLMLPKLNFTLDPEEDSDDDFFTDAKAGKATTDVTFKEEQSLVEEKKEEGSIVGADGILAQGSSLISGESQSEEEPDSDPVSESEEESEEEEEKLPDTSNAKTAKITRMLSSKSVAPAMRTRGLDTVWVVRCMRSITNAKLIEDTMLFSGSYSLQSGLGCRRTRFPEFVHSWFTPSKTRLESVCVHVQNVHKGVSTASKAHRRAAARDEEEREAAFKEADDLRWALYYGVKSLAQSTPPVPEATLFWSLLDETYQEDYLTFYSFCLQTLFSSCSGYFGRQFGVTMNPSPPSDHYDLHLRTEGKDKGKFRQEPREDEGVVRGPVGTVGSVWVLAADAEKAVNLITGKAIQEEKDIILRALNAVCITALGRVPGNIGGDRKVQCVDLHSLLNLMLHTYRAEQVNRTSALRLMFEAASAGRTSPEALLYAMEKGYGRKMKGRAGGSGAAGASFYAKNSIFDGDEDEDPLHKTPPSLDFLQFRAVMLSFAPEVAPNEISQMYRECHYLSEGVVNYECFLKVADTNQFFSRAASLPSTLMASSANNDKYSMALRHRVGSIVHINNHLMQEKFDAIEGKLPLLARKMFIGARSEVDDCIDFCSSGGCIDGMAPLAAYRRLLHMCLQNRMFEHEIGLGYDHPKESGEGGGKRAEGETVGYISEEIEQLNRVIRDYDPCPMTNKLGVFKKSFSVSRMVDFWRSKVAMSKGPPLGTIRLLRCGYLSGKGDIRNRRVYKTLPYLLQTIGDIYTYKVGYDNMLGRTGQGRSSLNVAMHSFFLNMFGIVSLAERAIHDLFYTIRDCVGYVARVKCFAAMVGLPPDAQAQAQANTREAKMEYGASKSGLDANSLMTSESMDDSLYGGVENGEDDEFEKSVTAERLLQLRQASTFFVHLIHKVHTFKKDLKGLLLKETLLNVSSATDKLVKKETAVKKGGRRASSVASEDFERSQKYAKEQLEKKAAEGAAEGGGGSDTEKEAQVFGVGDINCPSVPQLFPDVGRTETDKTNKYMWREPVDVLIGVAEILFDEVKSFSDNDHKAVKNLKTSLFEQIYAAESCGLVEVDEWGWHCMQFWAGIVKLRIQSVRRMTEWFGDRVGGKMLASAMHSLDEWKAFCMKKLPLSAKNFNKILEVRDQNEFFFESFHQTLLKAEQNFPMFVSGKRLHFGKVIAAFERGVMPTITLDIGGAKDMLQPLELMSDMVVKKQKELQKKLEEEKKKKEKEIGHLERGGSYAERARATQRAKLGIEETTTVVEEIEDWAVFDSFGGCWLLDSFESYASAINEWIEGVSKGEFILTGKLEGEEEKLRRLKEDLGEVEEEVGRIKAWVEVGGACGREEHKLKRVTVTKASEKWRKLMGQFHKLKDGDKCGNGGVTVEFAKDEWVGGRRVEVRGRNKVLTWLK